MKTNRLRLLVALLVAFTLVAAACSDDSGDDGGSDGTDDASTDTGGGEASPLDTNGDGEVVIGIATPGPRDNGAFYQALVEGIETFVATEGYADPIIVDNIAVADAETELRNLARQDVDVIAVGAGELSDPLPALSAEFADIFWYCNCGAGAQAAEGYAQSTDDSSQISYTAGAATAALMLESGTTDAYFLGCCDLDFEQEAFNAWSLGITDVDDSFTATYVPTGDFDDEAGATEAFNQALDAGMGAVYPFLGGAHETVVALANENDVITMSAGVSTACERDDLDYDIAVQFDAGDYLLGFFELVLAGTAGQGDVFTYTVGDFDFVGAKLCDGSTEAQAILDDAITRIGSGELDEAFDEIKSEAYGF